MSTAPTRRPCADRRPAGTAVGALLRRCLAGLLMAAAPSAFAEPPAPAELARRYPGADLAVGARLLREHDCAACHARRTGGDGAAIYRPQGRVGTPAALSAMVERCSVELNLGLFPEDIASVAAVLDRDHYRFRAAARPSAP